MGRRRDMARGVLAVAGSSAALDVPVVRVGIVATVVLVLVQVAAVVSPGGVAGVVAVVWASTLFAAGSIAFVWAFLVAAGRSRDEQVTIAGVIWLTGCAPAGVARALRVLLAVQVAVVLVTAAARPFSPVAFGILAPMFGLGCLAWYGARHGVFAPIVAAPIPPGSSDARRVGPAQNAPDPNSEPHEESPGDPDDFDQLFRRRRKRR